MTELIRVSQNDLENVNTTWTLREDVTLDSHGERCRINVTIRNLQFPLHEGFYRATVTGTDGTNSADLFIRTIANPEPLQLQQQPTNPTSGSDVTFTCTGNTGRPKPIVILLKSITDNEQILVQVGVDTDPVVEMLPDGRYFVNSSFARRVSFSDNGTFFACDIRYNIGLSQRLNNATSNRVPINIAPGSAQNQLNIALTSPVRQGQDDLRIQCSASGTIFTSITSFSIFRNDSTPTLKSLVTRTYNVISQTITTTWPNDNQNAQGRAVLSGNPLPFPNATFIMTIPRDDISCPGDAGGYQCQFSATVTPGSPAPDPTSNQEFVEIQTNPSRMNPMTVLANTGSGDIPVTNYRFSVGTVLTLSCTGTVGNPIQAPRWCHKKTSDFGWQSPASGVSTDGAVLVGCQNSQTTTYIHNVTSDDNDRMFLCEAGSNPQCGFGDISSNITMSLAATTTTTPPLPQRSDISCNADSIDTFVPISMLPSGAPLTWRDPTCSVTSNGTHMISSIGLSQCGTTVTITKDNVEFENELKAQSTNSTANSLIDFGEDAYVIPVKCIYPRTETPMTSYVPLQQHVRFYEKRYGHFDVDIMQYDSDKFSSAIQNLGTPRKVALNSEIYVEVKLNDQFNNGLGIHIDKCIATPTSSPSDSTLYTLLTDGCPASQHVHLYNSPANKVRFGVRAFQFTSQTGSMVYIHCQTSMCQAGTPYCTSNCVTAGRRKRDVAPDQKSHLVSAGPFVLVADEQGTPIRMSTIVASVSAFVAVVACVVAIVGWTRKTRTTSTKEQGLL